MASLKQRLPAKIYDLIERAGISTTKQILLTSQWDIKRLTNLNYDDIQLLKNVAADCCSPVSQTAITMMKSLKLPSGITAVDKMLKGGLRRGTLTELYGESGSGKTQLAIQAAAYNWAVGSVFICTEDLFPAKRFNQMTKALPDYSEVNDYGKSIFVEHITESDELLSCVRVRLPKLLEKNKVALIVLDSIAAPYRTDSTNYVQRAEDLRELAISLMSLAQRHNLAVLCINQVTASFDEGLENVVPSLGLAWSNMVSTRLWIRKSKDNLDDVIVREVSVVFAPDLPSCKCDVVVTAKGIESVHMYDFVIYYFLGAKPRGKHQLSSQHHLQSEVVQWRFNSYTCCMCTIIVLFG